MLRQELEFLERYLEIQQTRFRDRLTVHFEADPEVLDALVPTLVLQPLVENAVRHAIEPRVAPGTLKCGRWRTDGRLRLEVADDGPGMVMAGPGVIDAAAIPRSASGIGLSNTRARLRAALRRRPPVCAGELPGGRAGGLAGDPLPRRQPADTDPDSPHG